MPRQVGIAFKVSESESALLNLASEVSGLSMREVLVRCAQFALVYSLTDPEGVFLPPLGTFEKASIIERAHRAIGRVNAERAKTRLQSEPVPK